jgi:hypothetical protein
MWSRVRRVWGGSRASRVGALALVIAAATGCAAPKPMTTTERATLQKTCRPDRTTGSMMQRTVCVTNDDWARLRGRIPMYTAARRPVSDFDEP